MHFPLHKIASILILALGATCCVAAPPPSSATTAPATPHLYGTLQSDTARAAAHMKVGIRVATVGLSWNRFEPVEGRIDAAYVAQCKQKLADFRAAGMRVVLGLGLQYPPHWIFTDPNSRFVNQFGRAYDDPKSGANGVNAIFNQALRDKQARYVSHIFSELGTDFYAVRLGWGYYGELGYPTSRWHDQSNCFWAYDAIAQGRAPGLPQGILSCPVPGWTPGTPSPEHAAARQFVDWYLNALLNYQSWQIHTVRGSYDGNLLMLYPSWGMRPGQLKSLIAHDLKTTTTEVQPGLDFERLVGAIEDPKVIVYSTWIDSNPTFGNDASPSPAPWCPIHYLAYLAQHHRPTLQVWGENTGRGNAKAMQLSFQRMNDYGLMGLVWAFEPDLYSGKYATIKDYARLISENP
jgi:hypothetical protein